MRSRFREGVAPPAERLDASSERSSAGSRTMTGMGSSRLRKASNVNSSILKEIERLW